MSFNKNLSVKALSLILILSGCSNLGVQGGSEALTAKFSGVESVEVISPSSVILKWNTLGQYNAYNIYISSQDAPVGESNFNSYTINDLTPGTSYSFSVSALKPDGSEVGIGKQITATTWQHFKGPQSATAKDYQSIEIAWEYELGPTFEVYAKEGSTLNKDDLAGSPTYTTQSNTGMTASGLKSNTTYYFTVIAKYQDDTRSDQAGLGQTPDISAQYITTGLITVPEVTTGGDILIGDSPSFTVSNGPASYVTKFYTDLAMANEVASITGNGTVKSTYVGSAKGVVNFYVKVQDIIGGNYVYATLSEINVTENSSNPVDLSVSATTPTSLSPIPTVTGPTISVTPYPVFTVSGGLPGYKTELFWNGQVIGSVIGDGTITTLSSVNLPRGDVTISPIVTYLGETAYLPNMMVRVVGVDSTPFTGGGIISANGTGGSAGIDMASGDFNCDSHLDIAIGAPYGNSAMAGNPIAFDSINGFVAVYYGKADSTGIDFTADPQIIEPVQNSTTYGQKFGTSLAEGNFNNSTNGANPCSDLVVGATGDRGLSTGRGAIYVFYGSPSGLQSETVINNGVTCPISNNWACSAGKYYYTSADNSGQSQPTYGGLGYDVAAGDYDGDGYDEIVATSYYFTDTQAGGRIAQGAALLFWGSPNGISPTYVKILMPTAYYTANYQYSFFSVSMGNISNAGFEDIVFGMPYTNNGTGFGGFMYLPGNQNFGIILDASSRLTGGTYTTVQPDKCNNGDPWGNTRCGEDVVVVDVNNDNNDDIIVGSRGLGTGTNRGAFLVYYGSPGGIFSAATSPSDGTLTCTVDNTPCPPQGFRDNSVNYHYQRGYRVFNLGDTNGDGYNDVGVAAPGKNLTGIENGTNTYNGEALIYYGGPRGLKPAPITKIDIDSPNYSWFGYTMSGAIFRKGQTVSDLIISAPGENASGQDLLEAGGRVHYFQNPGGTGFPVSVTTPTESSPFINRDYAVLELSNAKMVGDVNGDGYDDVGLPIKTYGMTSSSGLPAQLWSFALYFGSPTGFDFSKQPKFSPLSSTDPILVNFTLFADPTFTDFNLGKNVYPALDANGDGFNDIVVGFYWYTYIFYGSSSGLVTAPKPENDPIGTLSPQFVNNNFFYRGGYSSGWDAGRLVTTGDFNGDGYDDIAGGAMYSSSVERYISVIYGSPDGLYTKGQIHHPAHANWAIQDPANQFERHGTCSGTFGLADYRCKPLQMCVDNVTGNCNGLAAGDYLPMSTPISHWNPFVIQSVGDVNKDGFDDMAVGNPNYDHIQGDDDGSILLLYGSATGLDPNRWVNLRLDVQSAAPLANRYLSMYLSGGHDINGDGIDDFIAGAHNERLDAGGTIYTNGGAAYVIYGINGGYQSVPSAGCAAYPCTVDLNNKADNVPDFVATNIVENVDGSCNPTTNQCNPMRIFPKGVFLSSRHFGNGVLNVGDISGDGFGEVAVSMQARNQIYIWSGSQSGLKASANASQSPICTDNVCNPLELFPPDDASYTKWTWMYYRVEGGSGSGDIDGNGTQDFFIISDWLANPTTGNTTGGFFLFY